MFTLSELHIFLSKSIKFNFIFILVILSFNSGCEDYPDLGYGYIITNDGIYSYQIINYKKDVMIEMNILEYAFDSTFIIASQRPWDSIPNIKEMTYNEANEAFENSKFRQYWILNKKEKNVCYYDSIDEVARISNVYGP